MTLSDWWAMDGKRSLTTRQREDISSSILQFTHQPPRSSPWQPQLYYYIGVCVCVHREKYQILEFKVHTREGAYVDVSLMHFVNDHMTDPDQT